MAPRLVVLGPVLLLATLAACGEAEEVPPAVQATPTPAATAAPTATPTPEPTATAEPTPAQDEWVTYTDPDFGFSIDYPPDLVLKDLTGQTPDGLNRRALEFRSPEDRSRAFIISASENTKGLSLQEWAVEFGACHAKSITPAMLGGIDAVFCTREVIEGRPGPAALAERGGVIFLISGQLPDSDFNQITDSFRF